MHGRPELSPAERAVAKEYKEQPPEGWAKASPSDAAPKGDWWTDFHDPLLDELEPQVAISNQTVRQNYANYLQAVAEVKVARAQLFPTLGLTGSVNRQGGPGYAGGGAIGTTTTGTTGTTTTTTTGAAGSGRGTVTSATLEGTASWTLDIWGKVRRLVEENTAIAQSDEATLANATLSEQTLLATTVIELRLADANIDLEQKTVNAFREALKVTKAQGIAGITAAPPSAVITAQVALETAQANLIGLGVARAQYAHAIAVLVGKNPEDLDIPKDTVMPTLPAIPAGVPSQLLERRPDIAAAERTMKAQNAAVGVAVAAYYPTISLSAAARLHAIAVERLAALGESHLVAGCQRHRDLVRLRRAARRSASGAGRVRGRRRELPQHRAHRIRGRGERPVGAAHTRAQAKALDTAVRDAIRGTEIAMAEFKAGTVDYITVAQAQRDPTERPASALAVEQSRLVDAVSLIGDLGGGWSAGELHTASSPQTLPPDPSVSPHTSSP